jgi:ATP-dependent protease HslVU (ClpYQ) peptidase subunit
MTLIVGVKCTDGIVIGADSAATYTTQLGQQQTIRQETATKLHITLNKVVIGVSGPIAFSQCYGDEIDSYIRSTGSKVTWKNVQEAKTKITELFWKHARPAWERAETVAKVVGPGTAISECNHSSAAAFAIGDEAHLLQFTTQCQAEEVTQDLPFMTLGSGQVTADPFLAFIRRIFWPDSLPGLLDGQVATVWTLDQVIKINPGGVGGEVQIVVLKKDEKGHWRCDNLSSEEINNHRQYIADIERRMREAVTPKAEPPPIPTPEEPETAVAPPIRHP